MASFRHFDLHLLNPAFDSPLVDVLNELEYLRRLKLTGSTPVEMFLQLKRVFHMLESLASARIEGNHTTLADYVETAIGETEMPSEQFMEIDNIEQAMRHVEASVTPGADLSEHLVRELHAMTVEQLQREGDRTPGAYRKAQVKIAQSRHLPPNAALVGAYMQELIAFVNRADPHKYDLIKIALAHHRFGWIHPFSNGNGRVVRLLTHALLIKYGFNVADNERVLNPTAVFCKDREKYYAMLSQADEGSDAALESWCIYVLQGVLTELQKGRPPGRLRLPHRQNPGAGAGLLATAPLCHGGRTRGAARNGQTGDRQSGRSTQGNAAHVRSAAYLPNPQTGRAQDAGTRAARRPPVHDRFYQQLSDPRRDPGTAGRGVHIGATGRRSDGLNYAIDSGGPVQCGPAR